ncbi:MAG: TatD family hydrolase [Bacteroidales bacterium]|nr:TatD family hydrolase [Candidatus Colimorpha merdihippi]
MIDTHCHLYDQAFNPDRHQAVLNALQAGVNLMILPAIDSQSHADQEALASQYPQYFRQMMGLHPTSVNDNFQSELDIVKQKLFLHPQSYVAVGEIGLDLYWDKSFFHQQCQALTTQMQWAQQLNLPVCLHVRKAYNELFHILRNINQPQYRGVLHCFGGSVQEALHAVDLGFHIGIGGVVTFKNATLAEVAKAVPLDRILLETDAPYLAPVPHRGHRNESAYIPLIADKIAQLRGISPTEVAEVTTLSAKKLFLSDEQ